MSSNTPDDGKSNFNLTDIGSTDDGVFVSSGALMSLLQAPSLIKAIANEAVDLPLTPPLTANPALQLNGDTNYDAAIKMIEELQKELLPGHIRASQFLRPRGTETRMDAQQGPVPLDGYIFTYTSKDFNGNPIPKAKWPTAKQVIDYASKKPYMLEPLRALALRVSDIESNRDILDKLDKLPEVIANRSILMGGTKILEPGLLPFDVSSIEYKESPVLHYLCIKMLASYGTSVTGITKLQKATVNSTGKGNPDEGLFPLTPFAHFLVETRDKTGPFAKVHNNKLVRRDMVDKPLSQEDVASLFGKAAELFDEMNSEQQRLVSQIETQWYNWGQARKGSIFDELNTPGANPEFEHKIKSTFKVDSLDQVHYKLNMVKRPNVMLVRTACIAIPTLTTITSMMAPSLNFTGSSISGLLSCGAIGLTSFGIGNFVKSSTQDQILEDTLTNMKTHIGKDKDFIRMQVGAFMLAMFLENIEVPISRNLNEGTAKIASTKTRAIFNKDENGKIIEYHLSDRGRIYERADGISKVDDPDSPNISTFSSTYLQVSKIRDYLAAVDYKIRPMDYMGLVQAGIQVSNFFDSEVNFQKLRAEISPRITSNSTNAAWACLSAAAVTTTFAYMLR